MQSEQINEIAAALAKAQGQMHAAKKDTDNPFFKSKYADLASVWDAIRKPLSDNGLALFQTTHLAETGVLILRTTLAHSSGQWMAGELPVNPVKNDPQGMGSALTYARRYGASAITGAYADQDDDGNAASRPTATTAPLRAAPAPAATATSAKPFKSKYAGTCEQCGTSVTPGDLITLGANKKPSHVACPVSDQPLPAGFESIDGYIPA